MTAIQITRKIAKSPWTNGIIGVLMLYAGLAEGWDQLKHIGAHHGVILLGFSQTIKALLDILESAEYFDAVSENQSEVEEEEGR